MHYKAKPVVHAGDYHCSKAEVSKSTCPKVLNDCMKIFLVLCYLWINIYIN
jgi:hypothetical protein